jgi:hypothetical protein
MKKMKKWSLLIILAVCSCSFCFGQRQQGKSNWIYVGTQDADSGSSNWYINSNKVVVNSKKRIIRVWVKLEIEALSFVGSHNDLSKSQAVHIGDRNIEENADERRKQSLALHEFNCTERTSRILKLMNYEGAKVVERYKVNDVDYITPDSVMEQVFNQACKRVRR